MDSRLKVVGGMGLGAGLLFLLDPGTGRRRLKHVRDRVGSLASDSGEALGKTARDVRNRAQGLASEARARLRPEVEVADDVLEARVRAKLGRYCSHPSAVDVQAEAGRVTLSGPVLAAEIDDLLSAVDAVRGVEEVDNQLEPHDDAADIPELQGGGPATGERPGLLQERWSPTARLLVGAAGSGLAVYGAKRGDRLGAALGSLGLGLLLRGLTDVDLGTLVGLEEDEATAEVRRAIHVDAPIEAVFGLWADYASFPRFLSHVREVRDLGEGRSHWVVEGPAGAPVEWEAVLTRFEPDRELSWRTLPGSAVAHTGTVRFAPDAEGGTRVDVVLAYTPPAGVLGHAVATLFGANPEQHLEDDLLRMKTFVESGRPAHDAADPEA
jgi:uncharacterized membrane protein